MSTKETAPFFSVIIPTYNRAQAVTDAVKSVLVQTYSSFEVIVVDDGSTDDTSKAIKLLSERDDRVTYIFQKNQERSAARNNGISQSKGKYICFLDSDDLYLPNHLSDFHHKIMENDSPKAIILANPVYPNEDGSLVRVTPFIPNTTDPLELVVKTAIPCQLTCINASILNEFKFDVNINIGEDQELWVRIVKHYPLINSNQYSVVIQDLGDRTINNMNSTAYYRNLLLKRKIFNQDKEGRIKTEWRKFVLSADYLNLAKSYFRENRIFKFYYYLVRSIIISPKIYRKEKLKLLLFPKS